MRLKRLGVALMVMGAAAGSIQAAKIDTDGKLAISADDGSFSVRIIGRVFVDLNYYKQGSPDRRLTSGAFIREARIGVEGNFREWEYKVEYDNAGDIPDLKSAYLRRWLGPGIATVGQFKVFESLDGVSSITDLAFMERSHVGNIAPGFQIGVGYNGSFSIFGFGANAYNLRQASEGGTRPINNGFGAVGRAYVSPINENMLALHLGGSYSRESTDIIGARGLVRPIGRADFYQNGDPFRFVLYDRRDEKAIVHRVNGEAAAINGPFSVQGEYMSGDATTDTQSKDSFYVWYGQASFVLSGEARRYDFRDGSIKRPEPKRAWGAVEVAARYQRAKRKEVIDAELITTDYGLTYYANANVRFLVNYSLSENKLIDDSPRLLSARAQFDF